MKSLINGFSATIGSFLAIFIIPACCCISCLILLYSSTIFTNDKDSYKLEPPEALRKLGEDFSTLNGRCGQIPDAMDISGLTEEKVKSKYDLKYKSESLTPSEKVKVTYFDCNQIHMQIDYVIETGLPIYIGYDFTGKPLNENEAWKTIGFVQSELPAHTSVSVAGTSSGTYNTWWEDTNFFYPYRWVIAIWRNGKIAKIAFSPESNEDSLSTRSPYYIP